MPYAPSVTYRGDQHIAQGFADISKSIAEYQQQSQQAQMQEGYVQAAINSGAMGHDKLAEFSKGNLGKKLALGAEAQVALKQYSEMQEQSIQKARLGEQARQFDVGRVDDALNAQPVPVANLPGALVSPKTGQIIRPEEDGAAADEWPPKIFTDPATKQSFVQRGGKAYPLKKDTEDAMKTIMAQFMAQQLGVAAPGGNGPAATGTPPLAPAPAANAGSALPTVTTAAQYQAIPAGGQYRDKDGNVRTKR